MRYGMYRIDLDPLRNIAPRNPTQTSYLRFLENPSLPMKTMFEDAVEEFEDSMELPDLTKTYYTDLLEEDDDD